MEVTTISSGTFVSENASRGIGDLIDQVVEKELVDFCYVARNTVVVAIGGRQFTFATSEGRDFLSSLVAGWAHSQGRGGHATLASDIRGRTSTQSAPVQQINPAGADVAFEKLQGILNRSASRLQSTGSNREYLDTVLTLATNLNVIEGYEKDEPARRIKLRTNATVADLTYIEALEYLTSSILEELRAAEHE